MAPVALRAADVPAPLPSFAELEAAGARIGEIRIAARDIFDTSDPREDNWLFRTANRLHIQTRPSVIERALLFSSGDPVSARQIEETERILRSNRYLYDVQIRPIAVHDGVVDIEVLTRDTWSLDPGLSFGRSGGANTTKFLLHEYNLLGTGTAITLGRSKDVDRTSDEFQFSNTRAFGTLASVNFEHATSSDGRRDAASVVRPFFALDERWAAGVGASNDDRIDSVYNAGEVVARYRHEERQATVFGGWSPGLVDGWVHRLTYGIALQDDRYALVPGETPPAALPRDERLVTPFLRYDLIEDRFERELNRNLIGRPEFFALGLQASVRLGYASTGFGSTTTGWTYSGRIARGFEPGADQMLTAEAAIDGRLIDGLAERQHVALRSQYYLPHGRHRLFFASAAFDWVTRPEPADQLLLGGDSGLRGYPLRYQGGTRRALFTLEERFYTDLYVWRLFHIGGAAFLDVGRAWGGANTNVDNPGWLGNGGIGLRIVSARAAFSNVLHIDLAFPFKTTPDIKRVQFLVKTKASF